MLLAGFSLAGLAAVSHAQAHGKAADVSVQIEIDFQYRVG
jgi:hypothetical protein